MGSATTLLEEVLEVSFTDGVPFDVEELRAFLEDPRFPTRAAEFKRQLAEALTQHTITPRRFETLTSIDHDSQEDLDRLLIDALWRPLYGDEPIAPE